jgi:transcriptional regulator GlxA family with amidase domain
MAARQEPQCRKFDGAARPRSFAGKARAERTLTSSDPRILRALDFIDNHLDRPVQLAEVARVAAVERKHFSRLFQRETGWRCSVLIRCRRLAYVQSFLVGSGATVAGVAAATGWDLRTMQRAFRKHTGLTPDAYRNAASVKSLRLLVPLDDHVPPPPPTIESETRQMPRSQR